jgi:hypothetical protein
MGLDINPVLFLIDARKRGANLGEVLTLGRQQLNVYPRKMAAVLGKHGLPREDYLREAAKSPLQYAEPCLKALGATRVYSLDASDFEGADFVHNLNEPAPEHLTNRFDTVIDGGTLEHVFNFPAAMATCMSMVKVGGRFIMHTVANNMCGHGFYQFSPELVYRIFSSENGFETERVIVHRLGPYNQWYEVPDPNAIQSRIQLITFTPIQMLVQARRVKTAPIFASAPQQSDYTQLWGSSTGTATPAVKPSRLQEMFPGVARVLNVIKYGVSFYRHQSLRNRKCFRPVRKP